MSPRSTATAPDRSDPVEAVAGGEEGEERAYPCGEGDCDEVFYGTAGPGKRYWHQVREHGKAARSAPKKRRDRPPREPGASSGRAGAKAPSPAELRAQLASGYELLAVFVARRRQCPICADAIYRSAGPCAEAWMAWANSSPRVREILERGMTVGGVLGVVAAHLQMVEAVATHQAHAHLVPAPEGPPATGDGAAMSIEDLPPEVVAQARSMGLDLDDPAVFADFAAFAATNGATPGG